MREKSPSGRGSTLLRAADRLVGIPVVAAAGLLKRRRPLPEQIRSIGILNSTAIGDTVLLSAVARDIAARFPAIRTVLFASEPMAPLLAQIDGVTPVPIRIAAPRAAIRVIRSQQLDVLLDFDAWPRIEPVYSLLSGCAFAAGFSAPGQHRHYAYDASVAHSHNVHELENLRRLAESIGVTSAGMPHLTARGRLALAQLPLQPYVVFHLWPTGLQSRLKEWPAERWHALTRLLAADGLTVVLTGSPDDAPRSAAFAASLPDLGGRVVDAAGRYSLEELLDLIDGSRCVVSVNTGIAHLAAAVGAPTVTLNGPTSQHRWGPLGPRAVSVDSEYDGCGYLSFGWEYDGKRTDCMEGISVESVAAAVSAQLERVADA